MKPAGRWRRACNWLTASVCAIAISAASTGCQIGPARLSAWQTDLHQSPADAGLAADVGLTGNSDLRIELQGGIHEHVSFVLSILPDRTVRGPAFEIEPPTAGAERIPSHNFTIYRMHEAELPVPPAWHVRSVLPALRETRRFDILVPHDAPRGGLPRNLPGKESCHFWVDVKIPGDVAPGLYRGAVTLANGDGPLMRAAIDLRVQPYALPTAASNVLAPVDHRKLFAHHVRYRGQGYAPGTDSWRDDPNRDALDGVLRRTTALLRECRLDPVFPSLAPPVSVARGGDPQIDWEEYDRITAGLDDAGVVNDQPLALPVAPVLDLMIKSEGAGLAWTDSYLAACVEHEEQRERLARSFALPWNALRTQVTEYDAFQPAVARLADACARALVVSPYFPQDLRPYGWLSFDPSAVCRQVDAWAPDAQFFDPAAMARARGEGKQTWMRIDRPPYSGTPSIHAPPADVMVIPWQARAFDIDAVLLPTVNAWPAARDGSDATRCLDHDDRSLLYPGTPYGLVTPVPSVRLMHLRRALEDVAIADVLETNGLGSVGERIASALAQRIGVKAYRAHLADGDTPGWPTAPGAFEAAREIMVQTVADASGGSADAFRLPLLWSRLETEAGRTSLSVDGARVRLQETDVAHIELTTSVRHDAPLPLEADIRLVDLPAGWTTDAAMPHVTVNPNRSIQLTTTIEAQTVPLGANGHLPLSADLVLDDGTVISRRPFAVSCITADWAAQEPVIDGRTREWPVGLTNVAGDFALIADVPESHPTLTRDPTSATTVFALRDDDNLYFAFQCKARGGEGRRDSRVTIDDMIPAGGELVEILLDPLNSGTRSPADTFHLVLKRSGSYQARVGVRTQPPCGPSEPWAVDLEYAVTEAPGAWLGEVRIPIAALGPDTRTTVWGLNLTRYDVANREYATWSGSIGNAYDPAGYGNLILPPPPRSTGSDGTD